MKINLYIFFVLISANVMFSQNKTTPFCKKYNCRDTAINGTYKVFTKNKETYAILTKKPIKKTCDECTDDHPKRQIKSISIFYSDSLIVQPRDSFMNGERYRYTFINKKRYLIEKGNIILWEKK